MVCVRGLGRARYFITQSREGAKEGGKGGAFPPTSCWSQRRAEHNSVQHPSCHTDRRVQRQNQIPPKTPSLQRRLEPIASRRIAPRSTDRRDRPQPALGRRKKGSRKGAKARRKGKRQCPSLLLCGFAALCDKIGCGGGHSDL